MPRAAAGPGPLGTPPPPPSLSRVDALGKRGRSLKARRGRGGVPLRSILPRARRTGPGQQAVQRAPITRKMAQQQQTQQAAQAGAQAAKQAQPGPGRAAAQAVGQEIGRAAATRPLRQTPPQQPPAPSPASQAGPQRPPEGSDLGTLRGRGGLKYPYKPGTKYAPPNPQPQQHRGWSTTHPLSDPAIPNEEPPAKRQRQPRAKKPDLQVQPSPKGLTQPLPPTTAPEPPAPTSTAETPMPTGPAESAHPEPTAAQPGLRERAQSLLDRFRDVASRGRRGPASRAQREARQARTQERIASYQESVRQLDEQLHELHKSQEQPESE